MDVPVHAVAFRRGVRELFAIFRPDDAGVAGLAVRQHHGVTACEVEPEELVELGAADVPGVDETLGRRLGTDVCRPYGLVEEGELATGAQRRLHAMELRGIAESRSDENAVPDPAEKTRLAGVLIRSQSRQERVGNRRHAFDLELADNGAFRLLTGSARARHGRAEGKCTGRAPKLRSRDRAPDSRKEMRVPGPHRSPPFGNRILGHLLLSDSASIV